MKLWRVDDVMTTDVVAVREHTPYREVVNVLIGRRISAVPVLDRFDHVVVVVSEADLLHKVEAAGEAKPRMTGWPSARRPVRPSGWPEPQRPDPGPAMPGRDPRVRLIGE